jgi:hypothetical protein
MHSLNPVSATRDLNLWWGLWLTSGVTAQWAFRMEENAVSAESFLMPTIMDRIVGLIIIASGWYIIKVVRNYDVLQSQLVNIPGQKISPSAIRYPVSGL